MALSINEIETWKETARTLCDIFPGGVIFGVTDREKLVWKVNSGNFDISSLKPGYKIRVGGAVDRAVKTGKPAKEKIPRNVYGVRLHMYAYPVFEGDEAVGAVMVVMPRQHPIAAAFSDFAPMIADLFPEGAFLYMTDLEKIGYIQGSGKFDMPQLNVGYKFGPESVAWKAINTKQIAVQDVDASVYGVPVMIMNYPCFDEDDASQVVATFGIVIPRNNAIALREMAARLYQSLEEISAVMEQMAAASQQITSNERDLNLNVIEILKLSEDINDILGFIKQIADETKMLGLNASIEAARAGELGRGFGVVAEEIRKLSDESKGTADKIRSLTNSIKDRISDAARKSELTMQASEEQAAASQEVTASIGDITSLAEKLDRIAQEM